MGVRRWGNFDFPISSKLRAEGRYKRLVSPRGNHILPDIPEIPDIPDSRGIRA